MTVSIVRVSLDPTTDIREPSSQKRMLLAAVRDGEVDAIVAWHPGLYRRLVDLEALITVVESRGVAVQTVSAGHVDLSTPAGRASARIIGTMARYESEQKGERHRSQHRELAQAGALARRRAAALRLSSRRRGRSRRREDEAVPAYLGRGRGRAHPPGRRGRPQRRVALLHPEALERVGRANHGQAQMDPD
jgi:DNA invertase Pin-like site-specific DNA recombinase